MDRPRKKAAPRMAERRAVRRHEESSVRATLRSFVVVFALAALALAAYSLWSGDYPTASVLGANLVLLIALSLAGRVSAMARHRSTLAVGLLVSQAALAVWLLRDAPIAWRLFAAGLAAPLVVLFFRFSRRHAATALVALWALTAGVWHFGATGPWRAPGGLGAVLWPTLASVAVWAIWNRLAKTRVARFVEAWRLSDVHRREHTRMREEIEAARQIQLDLLPSSTPDIDWLDLAGVSVPASEVGGDYYDYFEREAGSLALVVGDVAGHGLASGLMLSSLRSCLYLLAEELERPAQVLARLDGMVRHTASRRMLVTLAAAWLDAEERSLTLASAGHPPVLVYSAVGGGVRHVDLPALPLGTRLSPRFAQRTIALEKGDVLLLYTDGLLEMASGSGELYGVERLGDSFGSAASRGMGARETRDYLLADFANFKGDVRREDDVTVVVVKVR